MLSGLRSRWTMPAACALRERAADLGHDHHELARGHPPDALEALAEVLAVEELHGDVRGALPNAVVQNLDDVGAPELRGRLGLALEAGLRLGNLRVLALDEFHRAGDVEAEVGGVPHRAHSAAAELTVQAESFSDDEIGSELHAAASG